MNSVCDNHSSMLFINEDNDHYFKLSGVRDTEEALIDYIDSIVDGGAVTHFMMCVAGQRTSYDSKVWEPIWLGMDEPDVGAFDTKQNWCINAKSLADKGIDSYKVWISRCHSKNVSPWVSLRLNDNHYLWIKNYFRTMTFYREHPEYARIPGSTAKEADWEAYALDFAHEEVREYHLKIIREIVDRYSDADGLELDLLRTWHYFKPGEERKNAHILTELIATVRSWTNEKGMKLSVRVPTRIEVCEAVGMDVVDWAKNNLVDIVVPCNQYPSCDYKLNYKEWEERLPNVLVIPGSDALVATAREKTPWPLHSVETYRGWADLMYKQGAKGIYLFNVPYQKDDVKEQVYSGVLKPERLDEGEKVVVDSFYDTYVPETEE